MAARTRELVVFAWLPERPAGRFVPAGLLQLTETVGANPRDRELTSRFAYGLGYLKRPEAIEVDPVSLGLADREAVRGQQLFPVNGLGESAASATPHRMPGARLLGQMSSAFRSLEDIASAPLVAEIRNG